MSTAGRLPMVHTLRGFAALLVMWCHLATCTNLKVQPDFSTISVFGRFGVEVFFVISGFILPYAMWRGGYELRDFGKFIAKRLIRLEPPYWCGIAVAVGLGYLARLAPQYTGIAYTVTPVQLLLHLGYLIPFTKYEWILPVAWTLAVEFTFYLFLGLAFGLVRSRSRWPFVAFTAICAISNFFFRDMHYLPYHWPIFLMGMVVFRKTAALIDMRECLLWLTGLTVWAVYANGWSETSFGALAAACILWVKFQSRITDFFSDISYSLYLLHYPVGFKICNLLARYVHGYAASTVAVLGACAVCIGISWVLYRLVEMPSTRWSSALRYGSDVRAAVKPEPVLATTA